MLREDLKQYLDQIESEPKPIEEYILAQKISEILDAKEKQVTDIEELSEHIAFNFHPENSNDRAGWSTYYGPMYILPNDKGQYVEFPSIKHVDTTVLEYWRKRAKETKHPILAYRYADLVFDFGQKFANNRLEYEMAQLVIDSCISICERDLDDSLGCKSKLQRSMSLVLQINDKDRLQTLTNIIITTEKKYAEDDKPGLWGYAFKWLLLEKSDKVRLANDVELGLVNDLADRLKRITDEKKPDPWLVECAVSLLAEYYAKNNQEEELAGVLSELEKAYRGDERANSDGLMVVNYLEKLSNVYSSYSRFSFSKEAEIRISKEIGNMGERGKFDTHEISVEVPVKKEEIDKFVESIFTKEKADINKVKVKLGVYFVPSKDRVETQLKDNAKKFVFQHIVTNNIVSEDGYSIAKIGPIEEDYDQHLLLQFSQNLHFEAVFMRPSFEELRLRYTPDELQKSLIASPVFRKEDEAFIMKSLNFFWGKDYLPFNALAIPLIEDAIRNVFKINNQSYIRKNEDGTGYDVMLLHRLLNSGFIQIVFHSLSESFEYYLKVLLTSKIGWNLRNNYAHGINKNNFDSEDVANRLLHVLMCLSLIKNKDDEQEK